MEEQAVNFATQITNCKTLSELEIVSNKIKNYMVNNPQFKNEWRDWLLDIWWSAKTTLSAPNSPIPDILNKEGLKAMKKGLI